VRPGGGAASMASPRNPQTGKELANPPGGAYLWRVTNSDRVHAAGCSAVERGVCRDHRVMACRSRESAAGRVVDPSDPSLLGAPARCFARGDCRERPGIDPPDKRRRRGLDRDIGAMRRRLNCGVPATPFFRLTMSRWQIHNSPAAVRAARMHHRGAVASELSPSAAPRGAPFLYFSISSKDALRGAVGRPCRPSPLMLARGERVYHGQQNDHRRIPPRGNPGGGLKRQSRRGI